MGSVRLDFMKLNAPAFLRFLRAGLFLHLLAVGGVLHAQRTEVGGGVVPPAGAGLSSSEASQQTAEEGVPYSSMFRPVGVTLPGFNNALVSMPYGASGEMAAGEAFDGRISLSGLGASSRLPTMVGPVVAPDSAALKLGPVYLFVDSLTARLFWSRLSTHPSTISSDKWSSWIEMGFTATASIGDRFSLSVIGNLSYFPFNNQVTLTYSSQFPVLAASMAYLWPDLHGQIAYTVPVGNWPVTFSDDVELGRGRYSNSLSYTFEDFRSSNASNGGQEVQTFGRTTWGNSAADNMNDYQFGLLVNNARISTKGDVFGDFTLSASLTRGDFVYIPEQPSRLSSMEDFSLLLTTERETLRFKPYLAYDAIHEDNRAGIGHWVRLGVLGPVTEQVDLVADVGYFTGFNSGRQGLVTGRVELTHAINPDASESLRFHRGFDVFGDMASTSISYEFRQVLGPALAARFFAVAAENSGLRAGVLSDREVRTGIGVSINPGGKFTFDWDSYYSRLEATGDNTHGNFLGTEVDIQYRLTFNTRASLMFVFNRGDQYNFSYSSAIRDIVMLSIQRSFR